jgi:carboxypeptidase Q
MEVAMSRTRALLLTLLVAAGLTVAAPATRGAAAGKPPDRSHSRNDDEAAGDRGDHVDLAMITRIRDEGFHRSQVMATMAYLTDRIGPRLTGGPALKEANEWTRRQLADWGLANAHLEGWKFGRGWTWSRAVVAMVAPRQAQLAALPLAWTPGTQGQVRGEAVALPAATLADLDAYRGKLAGKIVLIDAARDESATARTAPPRRYSAAALDELATFDATGPRSAERDARRKAGELRRAKRRLAQEEKALATIEVSTAPLGILRVGGSGYYHDSDPPLVAGLVMAGEQYDRLLRLLDAHQKVELSVDVEARYLTDDPMAYNTVAEIPGTDPAGELVMAGAHLDSWHAGTGATDNGAGCAVVMEAMRILAALHVKPRRTVRAALWTGEEEGLFGSEAYVTEHFAVKPPPPPGTPAGTPSFMAGPVTAGTLTLKPDYAKLSAYFNIDNGSGKVRGLYAEENAALVPIFRSWLAPLADLGADHVTMRTTGSTDHVSFDRVGLPGFQFIQDELDYETFTHHTNLDVYEYLEDKDLMQASVVLAAVLYDAATRPAMLPRKSLPPATPPTTAPAPPPPGKAGAKGPETR